MAGKSPILQKGIMFRNKLFGIFAVAVLFLCVATGCKKDRKPITKLDWLVWSEVNPRVVNINGAEEEIPIPRSVSSVTISSAFKALTDNGWEYIDTFETVDLDTLPPRRVYPSFIFRRKVYLGDQLYKKIEESLNKSSKTEPNDQSKGGVSIIPPDSGEHTLHDKFENPRKSLERVIKKYVYDTMLAEFSGNPPSESKGYLFPHIARWDEQSEAKLKGYAKKYMDEIYRADPSAIASDEWKKKTAEEKYAVYFSLLFDSLTWQYPIKLGDSKEKVQSMLGAGELQGKNDLISSHLISKEFYTYSKSGVSITYNDFDRVAEIMFVGNYHRQNWIRYNGKIVFGIDLDMKLNDLNRILGEPINVSEQVLNSIDFSWKKDGILIECEIWVESFEDYGSKVEKDTIRFMELRPSI